MNTQKDYSYYQDSQVLITGGLGFIGSSLAHSLIDYGAHVHLVDSLIPDYGGNMANIKGIEDRVTIHISDIRDQSVLNSILDGKDIIFNLVYKFQ